MDETMKDPIGRVANIGNQKQGRYFPDERARENDALRRLAETPMTGPAGGYALGGNGASPDPRFSTDTPTSAVSTRWLIESKIDEHRGHIIRLKALLDLLPSNLAAISPLADDAIRMMVLQL